MDISLIIPFKNRASLVKRMLESLERATAMPSEIIFVDNGSTDEAPQLVHEFAERTNARQSHCHVHTMSCPNGGACAARNAGLHEAQGEWVYFFDSDDEFDPQFTADASQFLLEHPALDLVGIQTEVYANGTHTPRTTTFTASPTDQILCGQLATQSMLFRRTFFLAIGGWNESVPKWNDWELGLRALLAQPRMAWMTKRVYHRIYVHPQSITGKDFSSTYRTIVPALNAAEQLIAPHRLPALSRALSYRTAILAAHMRHEGHAELAHEALQRVRPTLQHTPAGRFHKFLSKLLYLYTAHGGRGAWRAARLLIRL